MGHLVDEQQQGMQVDLGDVLAVMAQRAGAREQEIASLITLVNRLERENTQLRNDAELRRVSDAATQADTGT